MSHYVSEEIKGNLPGREDGSNPGERGRLTSNESPEDAFFRETGPERGRGRKWSGGKNAEITGYYARLSR